MTKNDHEALLADIMLRPMDRLREELLACTLPSTQIEDASQIPASMIRAVRNGTVEQTYAATWGRMMAWVLAHNHGIEVGPEAGAAGAGAGARAAGARASAPRKTAA